MSTNPMRVEYLKKISVELEAGTSAATMDLTDGKTHRLDFIYGVGTEGITLFEKAIFEKCPGDEIGIAVPRNQRDDILGHLAQEIETMLPQQPGDFFLKTRVLSVENADEREIIRAVAAGVASDGCGGGCGCGCSC